jgi:hypothetical protein
MGMPLRSSNLKSLLARSWFPLALLALLLLAIPGAVLFALNLFGREGPVNAWLQERYSLSYHIPLAWWLGLILLLIPVALILLYFLKLKRKPLHVPSTFLWRKSIEDLHVNSLFQWLRQNVLLLLQLLALLVLIYALMDFRVHGRTGEGKHYILLIDNSASMAATDIAPSRLHWAKQEALKEIDAATDGDVGMVIVFNSTAEIYQSYTTNRGELRRAVERVGQTQRPTRIEEALSLADSLANPNRSADDAGIRPAGVEPGQQRTYVPAEGIPTEVHLFSDGRFADQADFALGNLNVHFHAAGNPGPENVDNLGLVTFNALRDEQDASKLQVFVRALNFRNRPVQAKVQLDVLVNGGLTAIQERPLPMPARQVAAIKEPGQEDPAVRDTPGEGAATFELSDVDDRANVVLHAKLVHGGDRLTYDDEAWLVVGVVRKARVLLVGKPNELLRAFFDDEATREVAVVHSLSPEDLARDDYRKPALQGQYDLVVFDRCGPEKEEELPRANTFFIGYPPPPWKPATVDKLTNPQIRGWMGRHPLMRYLAGLHEIGLEDAFRMKDLPPRTPRLIESDQNTALLLTLNRQSFTDLVMTFPLITDKDEWNTNWWRQPSFPLFLRNVLYTLGNVSDGAAEETLQPGQVKVLRPDVAVSQVEVADPAGNAQPLSRGSRADFAFGDTDRLGVYQVAWDGAWQRSFAVNLLDPDESNLEPRQAIQIGAERVVAGKQRSQPRETWKWLVLLALVLLLAEWYIYNKRVYV